MTAADSLYQKHGGLRLPALAGSVTDNLGPLDPARARLLALFESAIVSELEAVWGTVRATLPTGHALYSAAVVADRMELEPTDEIMRQRKAAYPLLALHRTGEATHAEHTLEIDRLEQTWELHYILGPLEAAHAHQLLDACTAVSKIVQQVVKRRGHPSYQSGAPQFFDGRGSLASVKVTKHEGPGQSRYGTEDGPIYWAIVITLETVELVSDVDGSFETLQGASYDVGVGGTEGVAPELIIAETEHSPSDLL